MVNYQHGPDDSVKQGRINLNEKKAALNEKKAAELKKWEQEKREKNNKRVAIDHEFNKILKKKIEEMEKKKSEDKNSEDKNSEEKDNQYNKEVIDKEFILLKLIDTGNLDDNDIRYIFLLRNTFNQSGNYEEGINKLLNDYVHEGDILNDTKDDLNFYKIMDESNNETLTPHIIRSINAKIEPYLKKPEEKKPKSLLQRMIGSFSTPKGGKRRKTSRRTRKPRRKSSRRLRRKSRRQRKR
jgi:hypothetical protein